MAGEQPGHGEDNHAIRHRLRSRWNLWRLRRAKRRAEAHRSERQRLERKYPDGEKSIPLPKFLYELIRAAVVGLKMKVKP